MPLLLAFDDEAAPAQRLLAALNTAAAGGNASLMAIG